MKDHLQKVLVVDAMPFFAGAQNPAAADTFSETQARQMLAMYNGMTDSALFASQFNMAKFLCRDSTRWQAIATWGSQSDRRTMAYTICEMLGNDMRKKISNIQVPVLVLAAYGKVPQYPQFTRESVTETFADQYKQCSKCTIHVAEDNTKHFVMYDAPDWYYAQLDAFLKS